MYPLTVTSVVNRHTSPSGTITSKLDDRPLDKSPAFILGHLDVVGDDIIDGVPLLVRFAVRGKVGLPRDLQLPRDDCEVG